MWNNDRNREQKEGGCGKGQSLRQILIYVAFTAEHLSKGEELGRTAADSVQGIAQDSNEVSMAEPSTKL